MQIFDIKHDRPAFLAGIAALVSYVSLLAARLIDTALFDRTTGRGMIVLLEFLIFILPLALVIFIQRDALTPSALRLRFNRRPHIWLTLSATAVLIIGGFLLTIAVGGVENVAGDFKLYDTFISRPGEGFFGHVGLIFTYALLPAICEEMMYRSLLCYGYESGGAARAIILSSILFGLLHFSIQLLPVCFFAGLLLALVLYATESVIAPIVIHFLYNLFGIYCQPYVTAFYRTTGSRTLFVIFTVALFLISAALFCFSASRAYANRRDDDDCRAVQTPAEFGRSLLDGMATAPFILCVVIFVITVIIF